MATAIQRQLNDLKTCLLKMSSMVEESLKGAILSLKKTDLELSRAVIEKDDDIDAMENHIDDLCLRILALQQPMAMDLRFIASAMGINHDLERVGDQAVNIAERVELLLKEEPRIIQPVGISKMARLAESMLSDSINAFVGGDTSLAESVWKRDDEVDALYIEVIQRIVDDMVADSSKIKQGVHLIAVALNLERIADLATDICEEVVFIADGRVIRHGSISPEPVKFKKSPFEDLKAHTDKVKECSWMFKKALVCYIEEECQEFGELAKQVCELESEADAIKRNIRGHLPRGVIMPVDDFKFLMYLREQDKVLDAAEDVVDWLSFRTTSIPEEIKDDLVHLADKVIESTELLGPMVEKANIYFKYNDENDREKVKELIREIRQREHEADQIEKKIKKTLFNLDIEPLSVCHLTHVVDKIGEIADHAENSGDMMRAMVAK
jgi:phosphate transport system regulatory protein PhoU